MPLGTFALLGAATAAGAAGSASSGKKGGGSNSSAADAQAQIAQHLIQQTDPLRASLINQSSQFLAGGNNPTNSPSYLALKDSADTNFSRARENTIASTAAGGGLTSALTNLEGQRAATLSQGAGAAYQDELSRALSLGTGLTQTGLGGLGTAGAIQAQMASANAVQNAGKAQGLGSGLGAMIGMKA